MSYNKSRGVTILLRTGGQGQPTPIPTPHLTSLPTHTQKTNGDRPTDQHLLATLISFSIPDLLIIEIIQGAQLF